jgi:integrase/recombinase XerD
MSSDNHDKHEAIANRFGRTTDPLADYDADFWAIESEDGIDAFELFLDERIRSRDNTTGTIKNRERHVRQFRDFMSENFDRHPACASTRHVMDWAEYLLDPPEPDEDGCKKGTVAKKLSTLQLAYEYFGNEPQFPHPTDFNPFGSAKGKIDLSKDGAKEPRPIPMSELRDLIQNDIRHIRDRGLIVTAFKTLLRASEVCNIKISEVHIANSELQEHYPDMGTHPALEGRPNALYVPHDRERNKRQRPTVIPLDDELRRVLTQYLLVRPDSGEPWLFLSKTKGKKLDHTNVNDRWKEYFRPEYDPNERFRGVTSHYGRHFGTTWFKIEQNWSRELVKYLRGDIQSGGEIRSTRDAIDSYIHTYYEDIEDRYRGEVFKFLI